MSDKIEAFDTVACFYDEWYEHPQGKQVFKAETNAINHMIPEIGLGLEIGSGTGAFTEALTTPERTIIGIDPSSEMTRKARERRLPCIMGVGDRLPIRDGLIDFTYMVTVLEFLDEPKRVFNEAKKHTRKDATFTVLFINTESSWGELYRDLGEQEDPVFMHARLYSEKMVYGLLEETGYKPTDSKGTLNSDPRSEKVDTGLMEPSPQSGVIIIKAEKN